MRRVMQLRARPLHEGDAIRPGPGAQPGVDVAERPVEAGGEVAEARPLDGGREEAGRGEGDLVARPREGLGEGDERMEMAIPGRATEEYPHGGAFPLEADDAMVSISVKPMSRMGDIHDRQL